MNPTFVATVISATFGFALAWQLQAHQIVKQELSHANERIAIQRAARQTLDRVTGQIATAQNNATRRVVVLRRDADSLRSGIDRLREQSAESLRAAASSLDACTATATTLSVISNHCATRYSELGTKAQGHVSDIQTLTESWPK